MNKEKKKRGKNRDIDEQKCYYPNKTHGLLYDKL